MIQKILSTDNQLAGTFLRLGLGVVIIPHGYQKLSNFGDMLTILETNYHLPVGIGALVILIEFFSPLLLLFGAFTRINAGLLAIVLFGAAFYHLENGFFMNWFGNQAGEGIQFSVLYVLSALALVITGGGKWALDSMIKQKINA